jgi:hypothetical protein
MNDYNIYRKESVGRITHHPCKRLISVTGIAFVRSSYVWLGCHVHVSETTACARLVPLKITPERRLGMGPGVVELLVLRGLPKLDPRLQSLNPTLMGGSSSPRPTDSKQTKVKTWGILKTYVTLTVYSTCVHDAGPGSTRGDTESSAVCRTAS